MHFATLEMHSTSILVGILVSAYINLELRSSTTMAKNFPTLLLFPSYMLTRVLMNYSVLARCVIPVYAVALEVPISNLS